MCHFSADVFRACSNRPASEMKHAHLNSFYQSTLVTTLRNYSDPLQLFCWYKQIFLKLFISWWHATVISTWFNHVVCHINKIKPVYSDVLLYNLKICLMWQYFNSSSKQASSLLLLRTKLGHFGVDRRYHFCKRGH